MGRAKTDLTSALRGRLGRNSPLSQRKQIFLPEFVITLIRTPFLPPRYASFKVPLNFNKLDMRDYMQRVYGVDVLGVRSYIQQMKPTRNRKDGNPGHGPWRRPQSKKKMTIEMTQPFVWPDPPKDDSPWDKDNFYEIQKESKAEQRSRQPKAAMEAPEKKRTALEQQAKDLLEGKITWRPTWQALGLQYNRPSLRRLAVNNSNNSNSKEEESKEGENKVQEDNKPSSSAGP
ncbi:hypothetical protein BGW36DRAFT_332217 [Talaromyces proteolyticus]|uniref:Large ribosomal subunit protein uL23m n=1 Tax=Talaromyces proteolyticus TaxID=1131652 RepID=A0AAD4Q688_9EURO|nr:uncharacterized protein BGW36DRAFT_332217 [Talaromyces proteolyticus]KAH8705117.1 hypothetical protein BGW36DRAFT_332217 [Talaromyces proteolyticus]